MLTARDCQELGIIDQVIPEPAGGAHIDPRQAVEHLEYSIYKHLAETSRVSASKLVKQRYRKFRQMGELNPFAQEAIQQEVASLLRMHAIGAPAPVELPGPTFGSLPALEEGVERRAS